MRAALALLLTGCAAVPKAGDQSGLLAASERLAAAIEKDGARDGLDGSLAEHATLLHPGAEVTTGRAAIRTLLTSTSAATLRLHSIAAGVSADGTLGYSFGWLEETTDGRAAWGKFIAAWIFDGGWKVAAFSRSASVQAPSSPPPTAKIVRGVAGKVSPGS